VDVLTIIGIDPGLTGALFAIDATSGKPVCWKNVECRGELINVASIVKFLSQFDIENDLVFCENPHTHAKDGIKEIFQAFRFGYSVGTLQAIPQAMGFKTELIAPITWKSWFGLMTSNTTYTERKELSVEFAVDKLGDQDMFIDIKQQGKVMKKIYKHDLAEAYLIACYGFEKYIKE
jgi:hypothetical protein